MPALNPIKQAAIKAGEEFYFTGIPCKRGHIAKRRTSNMVCIECEKARYAPSYPITKEVRAVKSKEYYYSNHEKCKGFRKTWREKHHRKYLDLVRPHCASRRAAKILRTPAWVNEQAMAAFYRECPPGMTVDHIIPLQGKLVSGLHVENNLQYLTKSENSAKCNTFDPERWEEPCSIA